MLCTSDRVVVDALSRPSPLVEQDSDLVNLSGHRLLSAFTAGKPGPQDRLLIPLPMVPALTSMPGIVQFSWLVIRDAEWQPEGSPTLMMQGRNKNPQRAGLGVKRVARCVGDTGRRPMEAGMHPETFQASLAAANSIHLGTCPMGPHPHQRQH